MAHGGLGKHRVGGKPMRKGMNGSKGLGAKCSLEKKKVKKKPSIKNQIRAVERLLNKNLPSEVRDVQRKRLEDLKNQAEDHQRAELERKMALRYHKVKFFERRKIERRIKHLENILEGTDFTEATQNSNLNDQLVQLKEDLEYVRFFPKTEKYVSLFEGNEDEEVLAKRTELREQIKANLAALEAAGVEPEDLHDGVDPPMAMSDDDFFLTESLSDHAQAGNQSPFTSSKTGPKRTFKNTTMPNTRHTSVSNKKRSHKVSNDAHSGSKTEKQRPLSMIDDDFFLAENLSDSAKEGDQFSSPSLKTRPNRTLKDTAIPNARQTSASNKEQSYKVSLNVRSRSEIYKQRPGSMFRDKDKQKHYTSGAHNKIKGRNLDDQKHTSVSKDSKDKGHLGSQKLKLAPSSSSLSQRRSRHQQARSQPNSSRSLNAASSGIAKDNAANFNVPSRTSFDASQKPLVPEIGSSDVLVPKKRRRKHRPKKKKA